MTSLVFEALNPTTPPKVGMVLRRVVDKVALYSRITHVFARTVYTMPLGTPAQVRFAKRPVRGRFSDLVLDLKAKRLSIGRVNLPPEFASSVEKGTPEFEEIRSAMGAIKPLVEEFDHEPNLHRTRFTLLINQRADALQWTEVTLRRVLLRYYYFGRHENALRDRERGPEPKDTPDRIAAMSEQGARRGRPADLATTLGPNQFKVLGEDVEDMVAAVERVVKDAARRSKQGAFVKATLVDAYEGWLHVEFPRRPKNKKIYAAWAKGSHVAPQSMSQFRRYVIDNEELSDELRQFMPAFDAGDSDRTLKSSGPGDVYELDATGGQIVLVDSKDPSRILATPTIYIVIDRWSRFIVSIYVTLRSPSWEALRVALRIAFTSRERRFKHLGYPVTDAIWPVGVPPAQLAVDRGSEMISEAMMKATVDGLSIEPLVLPPQTPDGKGIVEAVIKQLKRYILKSKLPGQYDKVTLDPKRKSGKRKAKIAAVTTLAELYRVLVSIVIKHNNTRVHRSLKKRSVLKINGIKPVPRDAYLWGLKNLTGIRYSALTDEDLRRMLLGNATAHLSGGIFTYQGRRYWPANAAARRFLKMHAGAHKKPLKVKVDNSDPFELLIPQRTNEWAQWKIGEEGAADLAHTTLEEQIALAMTHRLVIAAAENDALRHAGSAPGKGQSHSQPPKKESSKKAATRTAAKTASPKKAAAKSVPPPPATPVMPRSGAASRRQESNDLDRILNGNAPAKPEQAPGEREQGSSDLAALIKARKAALVAANQKERKG
jgi:putative transposase